jgi:hypothetical protein
LRSHALPFLTAKKARLKRAYLSTAMKVRRKKGDEKTSAKKAKGLTKKRV